MPIYAFETKSGEQVERMFPMVSAPKIGDVIVDDEIGELTRIASFSLDTAGIARKTHQYPFVSDSLDRGLKGCKHTLKGKPIVRSQKHEQELCSRHNLERQ